MRSRKYSAPQWKKPKPKEKIIATPHDLDTYRAYMALFNLLVEEGTV